MFDFFGYLRRKAREAILGGCQDAMDDLSSPDTPTDLERFRNRLLESVKTKELPASSEETTETTSKKKGSKS